MRVEVLIATMNRTDTSLLDKMNIQTDVVVGNQTDNNSVERFEYRGNNAVFVNTDTRGVGINRNQALMRADADICLFADDDMVYVDGYAEKIKKAFCECPRADVIVFNLLEPKSENKRYIIPKCHRVGRLNFLRYGAARIAVKLQSVREKGIYFNPCFGGGTEHAAGEDVLFLSSCLDKGLKIYAYPEYIAELTEERESTWFKGYNEKFMSDKGMLYKTMSRRWWKLLCLQDAIRHNKLYGMSKINAYKAMLKK